MANQYLSQGSRGDSVRQLQQMLNRNGAGLAVDGVYGNQTRAAVANYQRQNGLKVDGIAGSETMGSLQKGPVASVQPVGASVQSVGQPAQSTGQRTTYTSTSRRSGVSDQTAQALAGYEQGYKPSQAVLAAQQYLQQVQQNKPGAYQSPYEAQLNAMYEQISQRKPFTYDLNGDRLYQQYRDQYQNLGQRAMTDTMGQAAGLTGGYGSTYSQNAGQQAYQGYLQQLNDKVPELYRLALDKYNAEGDDLYRQYGLLNDRENTAYGRYRDSVDDWRADRSMAYGQYQDERGFDYGQWGDMLRYWQGKADSENSDWWKQTEFDYQKERDRIADEQWERQFAAAQAARAAAARGGGYGGEQGQQANGYGAEAVPGVKQGRVEIPGYGTVSYAQYLQMLRSGMLNRATLYNKTPEATMRKKQYSGAFDMLV